MAKTIILIRGRDGNAKYFGNVKGVVKILKNDTNGMPGGYHINAKDGDIVPATFSRGARNFLVFEEGNPNPIPFTGKMPELIVVGVDGKPSRAVQVGILAGPLIGQVVRDGLYSRKNAMNFAWKTLVMIGVGVLICGYLAGQTYGKFW